MPGRWPRSRLWHSAADPASAATGCWYSTTQYDAKALAGNTIGTERTIGGWCASGTRITKAYYIDGWAETRTPGWQAQSHRGRASGVVSNQGRTWERHRLYFGTTWLTIQEVQLCPRVKGTVVPGNARDNYCSIY